MKEDSIIEHLYNSRRLKIFPSLLSLIFIVTSIFHLWTGWFGFSDTITQRGVALTLYFLCVFGYRAFESGNKIHRIYSIGLFTISLAAGIYLVEAYSAETVSIKLGALTSLDVLIGVVLVILVLEGIRVSYGLALVVIVAFFIFYAMYGEIFPGVFAHKNMDLKAIINILLLTEDGIIGSIMGMMATYLFLYILFGSFFASSRGGDLFIKMASHVTDRFTAGPALTPVIASALFGTISGSPTSNVMVTGAFTIPLMKKAGYSPEFAAAMESTASSGGQIMPPIMGIAAFVMAEVIGVDYGKLMLMAVLPALLYYWGLSCSAYFETKYLGLMPFPRQEGSFIRLLSERGHLLIPLILMVVLIITGASLMRAAFVGCILTLIVSCLRKNTRMSFVQILGTLESGARQSAPIGVVMAWVGIIMALIASSGFGSKLGGTLLNVAGSSVILALFVTMVVALILGMGMTTVAVYIVVAITLAPPIIRMGVNPVAAHLFGFYFGCLSFVTPPVCLATYAAAALAKANVFKAGLKGFLVAISGFLIPYVIVFEPALILQGPSWTRTVLVFLVTAVGILALTSGISGFLIRRNNVIERVVLICGGLFLIWPDMTLSVVGAVFFVIVFIKQYVRRNQEYSINL